MNASNIVENQAYFPDEQAKETAKDIKETLTLLKQFYDVPIVKFTDFSNQLSEKIITCDDSIVIENELTQYQQRCTEEKLYLYEDTFFDGVFNNDNNRIRFYAQFPIYSNNNTLMGLLIIASLAPKSLAGSQKDQFISFAQLLQTQINKSAKPSQETQSSKQNSSKRKNYIHIFSLAPVSFLIALVLCAFTAVLLYSLEKKELQNEYNQQTQQLRETLFNALERFDNQGLYISQKDLIVAGFLQSQSSYTKEQLNNLVQSQAVGNLTYKGYVVFDSEYNQLAFWSKNNFNLAAYGFKNWLSKFNNRSNKNTVEVFTVADTAFLVSEIKINDRSIYTITAFDLSKFLKSIIGKLNTQNYDIYISTPQFTLGKQGEVSPRVITHSISALSNRFPPTWRLHVQPIKKITPPITTKYSLFRLGFITFLVFISVYYFLRLPRRLHDELKQKNQLILNREKLFSSSINALPHGFAIFNSNEQPVITNDAFNQLFSKIHKQNNQLSYTQLISIAQQHNIINHYHEHNKLDNEHNQLIDIGFTDGKWITVLQRHTNFGGFVCYFRDDTEAHQKETLLADVLKKSKESNQLKEKFVTRLSQQLKSPLTSLKSIIEVSKKPMSSADLSKYISNISIVSEQLECVIQQLININKSKKGKLKLKVKPINLNKILNNISTILNKDVINKNVLINNNINDDISITSDEKLISQLILQLSSEFIGNSYKSKLTINTEVTKQDKKDFLNIHFSIDNLANSKDFYEQLREVVTNDTLNSNDDIDSSLEIKFFISVFKMLGGQKLDINERNKTTTISLCLLISVTKQPLLEALSPIVSDEIPVKQNVETAKTLLLVDDEPLVEIVIKAMLKNENIIIDYACNAIEAMLFVSQNNYDIILMDIVMPELSGTDAMLKIKKHVDSGTKIIAHTSNLDTDSKYVKLGFDDTLLKPVKQAVLIEKIGRFLQ